MAAQSKQARGSIYGVHPGVEMVQKWIAGLKEKTGRSLEEWMAFVKKDGPKDEKSQREWLKVQRKLGTNAAWWIAARVAGKESDEDSPEKYLAAAPEYVAKQYSGKKQALRPIFEELLRLGKSMGGDVKACPCLTMVPLYRNHVFAQIKPTTNTRVDFGLCLTHYKGKLPKQLVDTGGTAKKDRITHRIEIADVKQIDADVRKWAKRAYELDGKEK
ncbi:MAG TPA: DUF5655 domain-containing protein [Candidatus Acidoferrum sp.]|jgi:hypothetical protein